MNRAERDALARLAAWLKPGQHVEVSASNLRWLLERANAADALERDAEDHVRIIDGYIARCGS